jgi:hypothetical protein
MAPLAADRGELKMRQPSTLAPAWLTRTSGVIAFVAALLSLLPLARAQVGWEYSPYRVQVWTAYQPVSLVPEPLQLAIGEQLRQRAETTHGAAWELSVGPAPLEMSAALRMPLEQLTAEDLALHLDSIASDKLLLVTIDQSGEDYRVRCREIDCRARQLSPVHERSSSTLDGLALAIWDAISAAFTPLARIESVDGKAVVARLRAAELVTDPQSRLLVQAEDVFQPVIRRNDRSGKLAPSGIVAPEWTLLRVTDVSNSRLSCELISGFRNPIPVKATQRTERLALLVRPAYPETRLRIVARTRPHRPLVGYELMRRVNGTEEVETVGITDSNGVVVLPAGKTRLDPLIVRNGGQLLARLPVLPGQAPELTAMVVDDDGRMQAEGFVRAFQSRVMDVVARRELLAAQIRKQLEAGKVAEAQSLLEQYRLLETRADLTRELTQQQQTIRSADRATTVRIQQQFSDAQKLLFKFLDPEQVNQLSRELAAAKARPPAAKPASAKTDAAPMPSPARP